MITALVVIVLFVVGILAAVMFLRSWNATNSDRRRLQWLSERQYVVLSIEVPRNNEKSPLAAEQMFAALHGMFQSGAEFQEHISFEIVAHGNAIKFYVFCPTHLQEFVEGQIYAQYPTIEITKVEDYSRGPDLSIQHMVSTELEMTKPDVYPIKTFVNFTVDPLSGITAPLSKIGDDEQLWIQLLIKPLDDSWHANGVKLVESIKKNGIVKIEPIHKGVAKGIASLGTDVLKEMAQTGSIKAPEGKSEPPKLSSHVESALKGIEEKITKLGYSTKIRVLAIAPDVFSAQAKVMQVVAGFKQFNTTNLNGFAAKQLVADDHQMIDAYSARAFEDKGFALNIEELASLYHLPTLTVETPNINWNRAKKGEPPGNLPLIGTVPPDQITEIGQTNFRNIQKAFGIKVRDRARHMYVVGKSGTGKSTLMENMINDDINEGRGVILVDPHGELVDHVLKSIPQHRLDDVILFDPSDRDFPIGFNLLERVNDDLKGIIASGFVGIFEKMFSNSWGPRLEHILRNTVLALLDYPDSTMLGIPRMLTDKKYRAGVVEVVKDPVIRDFWENEFASWDAKFASEAVAPILNKVGQFIATPTIRNIVGQKRSTFDVRQIMDEGKILLINLTRGKIGEDNSAMLGAMMITKIQLAAMSRADIPEEQRTDSFMYVDEFQNFATKSFATILSEARKYHLSLTMANQYIAQMQEEVRDAVFGNVGTIIAFRVGSSDASELVKEFTPEFTETDLVNQDIHKIYIKLSIDGTTGQAFSACTIKPNLPDHDYSDEIREQTRQLYSRPREEIEDEIISQSSMANSLNPRPINGADGTINLPPIKLAPDHIINGVYYKELHSKGGVKWWEGQPVEVMVAEEEKKRQKFLAKKIEFLKNGRVLTKEEEEAMMAEVEGEEEGVKSQIPMTNDQGEDRSSLNHNLPNNPNLPNNKAGNSMDGLISADSHDEPNEQEAGERRESRSARRRRKKREAEQAKMDMSHNEEIVQSPEFKDQNENFDHGEGGTEAPLRSTSYEGRLTSEDFNSRDSADNEENAHRQGSKPEERVQNRNTTTFRDSIQNEGSEVFPEEITKKTPKNDQNLTNQSKSAELDDFSSELTSLEPELELPAPESATELQLPSPEPTKAAHEALQGPTSPDLAISGTNTSLKPILQGFIERENQQNENKSIADRVTSVIAENSDELEEGVPYTFDE